MAFQDSFEEFYDEKNLKKRSIDQQFYLPERKAKVNQIVKTIEHCDAPDTVYCICRSTDGTRFMIACDNCEEWYHGDCIGISEKDATFIKQYYCNTCKGKDQSLVTKYKHKKHKDKTEKKLLKILPPETLDKSATEYKGKLRENETAEDLRKKSSRRCGGCHACYRTEDCGRCDFCKDMKKYGGPNRIRQKCRLRQCSNFGIVTGKAATELEDRLSSKKPDFNDSSFYDYLKDESQENLERQERLERQEKKRKKKLASKNDKNDKNDKGSPRKKQKDKKSPTKKKHSQKSKDRKSEFRFEVEDVRQEPVEDVPKQCLGPGCVEHARTGSKYCSDECGMKLAKSRIYELLPPKIQQWQSSPCVAEEKNKRMLEKIRREQQETRQKLVDLDQRHQELDAIVEKAKLIKAESDSEQVAESEDESEYVMFCVTCGLEINQKVALRHMEKCFAKFEAQTSFGSIYKTRIEGNSMFCDFYNPQQKTYCKRLKVLCPEHTKEIRVTNEEVCGSPMVSNVFEESEEDLCRIPKRKCSKHYCWEKCRRAQIDLERVRQWMKIDDLFEQERNIRHTISNRMGVLGLMLHQAVDHNPLNPIIVPDMD